VRFIDTHGELLKAAEAVASADRLGVDTEADSLHRYVEKLCLVQVSTSEEDFVIDPLAGLDLREFLGPLGSKLLIFHGADYDLRLLRRTYGFEPRRIFDTLVAAQLLGVGSPGLAALVERYYGAKLSKANQKADWSRRPLTAPMIDYAAKDTHYLLPLASQLERELEEKGRVAWFEESCADVLEASKVDREVDPSRRWRVKGAHALKGRELAMLKALWEWREDEARRRDRPSFKVLQGEALIETARWVVAHRGRPLGEMPRLPRSWDGAKIKDVERRIAEAWRVPLESLEPPAPPSKRGPRRLSASEKKALERLKEVRKRLAGEVGCDPGILAPNTVLEHIVIAAPADAAALVRLGHLKRWQADLLGGALLEALHVKEPT
jgi:ribonuclease D